MAGPTDLNPNAEPSVRPYSMSPSEAAYYRSREFGPVLGRAVSGLGAGALDAASQGLSGLDQFLSGNAPYQQFERQMAENNADYELNRSGVLTGNTGFSRQARIAAASNDVQNAPAMVAQRNAAEARQAAMMDNQAQARQEEQARQVETLANAKAAEVINSQNEVIRARQEQQALLATPIGTDPAYAGKRPMVSTPTGQRAAPQAKSLIQDINTTRFQGNYKPGSATYKPPTGGGDIGTINLVADAPDRSMPVSSQDALVKADEAMKRNNPQMAAWNMQLAGQMFNDETSSQRDAMETLSAQLGLKKLVADTQKSEVETEISKKKLLEMDNPESILTADFGDQRILWADSNSLIEKAKSERMGLFNTDLQLANSILELLNVPEDAPKAEKQQALEGFVIKQLRNGELGQAFVIRDMVGNAILERAKRDSGGQRGAERPKPKSAPTDMFKTPRAE